MRRPCSSFKFLEPALPFCYYHLYNILDGCIKVMNTHALIPIPRLSIIIPCYNEQHVLPDSLNKLSIFLLELINKKQIQADSFLYCVDDGSQDDTWQIILDRHGADPH